MGFTELKYIASVVALLLTKIDIQFIRQYIYVTIVAISKKKRYRTQSIRDIFWVFIFIHVFLNFFLSIL